MFGGFGGRRAAAAAVPAGGLPGLHPGRPRRLPRLRPQQHRGRPPGVTRPSDTFPPQQVTLPYEFGRPPFCTRRFGSLKSWPTHQPTRPLCLLGSWPFTRRVGLTVKLAVLFAEVGSWPPLCAVNLPPGGGLTQIIPVCRTIKFRSLFCVLHIHRVSSLNLDVRTHPSHSPVSIQWDNRGGVVSPEPPRPLFGGLAGGGGTSGLANGLAV